MRGLGKGAWRLAVLVAGAIACSDGDAVVHSPCVASMFDAEIAVRGIDHVDLLLVISDAASMVEEQAALQSQLPAAMHALLAGEVGGESMYAPIEDLNVAVVSASLADGGDLHRAPADAASGCTEQAPSFLRYRGAYFGPEHDDPDAFVDAFGCLARVGTASTAPSQPLAAALRALSDPQRAPGFLRNDPSQGLSLIQIVVISDSDDHSADQAAMLESVQDYVEGLQALRSDQPWLVAFSVMTGVPPALVDADARAGADLSSPQGRDAYYQRILEDPAMQVATDPENPTHLRPACESEHASAEPGRRLIEAARAFGENGNVLSICGNEWDRLIRPVQELLSVQLDSVCLPKLRVRRPDGSVACKLYWDLPSPDRALEGTPTRCDQRRFLQPAPGKPHDPGGQRCEMRQLAIDNEADLVAADPDDGGWYYDDFSIDRRRQCIGTDRARVAFTPYSAPQAGITLTLECFEAEVSSDIGVDGDRADTSSCGVPDVVAPPRAPYATGGVGDGCMPSNVPAAGFDDQRVYLETGSSQCASGVCMVYHLRGDPRPECTPCQFWSDLSCDSFLRCADREEIPDRIYCSCRCDAGPNAPGCACPDGFSCQDTFTLGGPGYEGGYCVKDGTVESR